MNAQKALIVTAMTVGVAVGSYGIAAAANGTTDTSTTTTPSTATAPSGTRPAASSSSQPWGGQRSDETPLTGDALAKLTAIANSKVSGGTVVRVETDADGHAKYEAHMTDANGNPVTVYVDAGFNVVSVESGR
jgi:uncharacterized membrane protein YkoI